MELLNLSASVVSIALAIVAIVLSIVSERRAGHAYEETLKTLHQIDSRAAVTESTVGTNFKEMMDTVLGIVETATTDKEVQKAEALAEGMQSQAEVQKQLFTIMQDVMKSGDKDKVDSFLRIFEAFTKTAILAAGQQTAPPPQIS